MRPWFRLIALPAAGALAFGMLVTGAASSSATPITTSTEAATAAQGKGVAAVRDNSTPGEQQPTMGVAHSSTKHLKIQRAHSTPGSTSAGPTAAQRALQRYGYLVPNRGAHDRAKARAARRSGQASAQAAVTGSLAPVQTRNFAGISGTTGSPSDSTGAVGTTRYMELVNSRFALYSRTNALLGQGTLHSLIGANAADNVFDPQVIWDPTTSRFYYASDQITTGGSNLLAVGFSKTASPTTAADFCKYTIDYGTVDFPDYPKLGDTQHFWVLGVNVFSPSFSGSDLLAITKPPAGSTCPAPASFGLTVKADVKNANGTAAFTPVPANQTDTSGTGWVVARPASVPATFLTVYKITRNATSGAAVISNGSNVAVPSYTVPANAPQNGSTELIDTSDTRNTQAVSAVDPLHSNLVGLWTQHTTAVVGGGRAEVRWYEINPVAKTLFQSGKVTSASLFSFNGAISPDRKALGATRAFGGNMVMNFNTSSATTFPAIKVVSKIGAAAQSAPAVVITSAGPGNDFTCPPTNSHPCRWGDYAAATPDPAASATAARGVVFGTNQYTRDGRLNPGGVNWLTRNFSHTP